MKYVTEITQLQGTGVKDSQKLQKISSRVRKTHRTHRTCRIGFDWRLHKNRTRNRVIFQAYTRAPVQGKYFAQNLRNCRKKGTETLQKSQNYQGTVGSRPEVTDLSGTATGYFHKGIPVPPVRYGRSSEVRTIGYQNESRTS